MKTIVAHIEVPEDFEVSAVVVKKFILTMKRHGPKDGGWHEQRAKFEIIEQPADGAPDEDKLSLNGKCGVSKRREGVVAPVAWSPAEEVDGPNECGIYTAYIHVGDWGARISCRGKSAEDAISLRDQVLNR